MNYSHELALLRKIAFIIVLVSVLSIAGNVLGAMAYIFN
jgi:hypothetical protein